MILRGVLFVALLVLMGYGAVAAKGDSYLVGATIGGNGLTRPLEVKINLPEGYGYLTPIEVPAADPGLPRLPSNGGLEIPVSPPPLREPRAGEVPYALVLHYDLSQYGLGLVDWAGRFDGKEVLYLPEPLIWGDKWEQYAGWYKADPLLAEQLQRELDPSLGAPSTGDAGLADISTNGTSSAVLLATTALALIGAAALHRRPFA